MKFVDLIRLQVSTATLLVATASSALASTAISVDGDAADWAGVPILLIDPSGDYNPTLNPDDIPPGLDILSLQVANDVTSVYFLLRLAGNPYAPNQIVNLLHFDADRDASTGDEFMEPGGTLGVEFTASFSGDSSFLSDNRPGPNAGNEFSGGLLVTYGADFVEASIPISTFESFAPGFSGFDVSTNNDDAGPVRYFLTPVPEPEQALMFTAGLLAVAFAVRRRRTR